MISAMRRNVYGCLSLCFDYPSRILVEEEAAEIISETFGALARCELESLAFEVDNFKAAHSNGGKSDTDRLVELEIEYNRLFVGPYKPLVYPCESIFLEAYRSGATGGQYLVETYRQEGLGLASDFEDLPDHISAEFEFMAHLCSKEIEADEAGRCQSAFDYRNKQEDFIKEHVIVWVPPFLQIIERATTSDFYKSLARITRQFIRWDYEQLSEVKSESVELWQT